MPAIHRILVANRGEIARKVFRVCESLGISTVAVFSDADADLPHVLDADRAVRIGPAAADASYLSAERILDAARRTGADAIHPGYGFLAENADFAEAVQAAGLVWIGPTPAAMRAMGDKAAARQLAAAQGVPCVPGYDGDDQSDATLAAEAERIGYPLLVKAAAGGGGRGMRRVNGPDGLADALASARREAKGAFGDDSLLLERLVERPRHVEVQVFGDTHGQVIHLGERECSVQRRHQKILEEAPSPAVDTDLRRRLGAAAVKVAGAVDYVGAGTVEFLLAPDGSFYFLEMNTRLQVEHPVTERVTFADLVAMQIRVAEGEPLGMDQDEVDVFGHAIEARVYAEDPLRDYLPASGTLVRFDLDGLLEVDVDAGYEEGDHVGVYYDPLLAKVIAWGEDRRQANRLLRRALDRAWIPGIVTNLPLLRQVVAHPAWEAGDLDTGFLDRHGLPEPPPANVERGALAATLATWWARVEGAPWGDVPHGWRLEGAAEERDTWRYGAEEVEVSWRTTGPRSLEVTVRDTPYALRLVDVEREEPDAYTVELDGVVQSWRIAVHHDGEPTVYAHFGDAESMLSREPRFPVQSGADAPAGSCVAPTPGTVAALHVAVGDTVSAGDKLATLEAMKMEHVLSAPEDGVVAAISVEVGQAVDQGAVLLRLETREE